MPLLSPSQASGTGGGKANPSVCVSSARYLIAPFLSVSLRIMSDFTSHASSYLLISVYYRESFHPALCERDSPLKGQLPDFLDVARLCTLAQICVSLFTSSVIPFQTKPYNLT